MTKPEPVVRLYRTLARVASGAELTADRVDEMSAVFGALWRDTSGRPAARARLLIGEAAGLVTLRSRLRRARRRRDGKNDWSGRDGMGEIWRDFKLGLRVLWRSPVTTAAAVITLALGIGGTTAVYTVADGVLFDPIDLPDAGELVSVLESDPAGNLDLLSHEDYVDLRAEARTLESFAVYRGNSVSVTGLGEPERIRGEFVSASYFDVLATSPSIGRAIERGEDVTGGPRTAVLSHGYWVRRFAADPNVLGRAVSFNNVPHTIVGVMPEGFRSYLDATDAWISAHTVPGGLGGRGQRSFLGIARLADGVDPASADRELDALMGRLAEAYPELSAGGSVSVRPLSQLFVGDSQRTLVWSLLGAIGLVLLIATANVANLQLARASQRSREMAIRSALGGGRQRLLTQLLVESLSLAAIGGVLGLVVALAAIEALVSSDTSPLAYFDVALSVRALAVAALVTLGAGTLAGLLPAVRGSAIPPADRLREDGRASGDGRGSGHFRSGLVVAQIAMAVTLLIGAGLLLRTTAALSAVDVGFDPRSILTGETRLTAENYLDDANRRTYMEQVVEALGTIPGTRGATLVGGMPFSGDWSFIPIRAEGSEQSWEEAPSAYTPAVATGYFDLLGIPLVAGRLFERTDGPGAELVVVASRALADRIYPGRDPVGLVIETPEGAARIIGLVEDARITLTGPVPPTAYLHYLQVQPRLFSVMVRTEAEPMSYERALREAFWSVDSNQPLWEVTSLETRIEYYSSNERFFSMLVGSFAALALLLAAVGIYGVMAHAVGRRRHELGVRLALGAGRARVLNMVLRQGVGLTLLGAGLGLVAGAAFARVLASVLFGVSALDPIAFLAAPAVLVAVAALAVYVPARRATRVNPVEAFRG